MADNNINFIVTALRERGAIGKNNALHQFNSRLTIIKQARLSLEQCEGQEIFPGVVTIE